MVEKFTQAAFEGIRYSIKNPEEAVEAMLKDNPLMEREATLDSLKISFELFPSREAEQKTLGWMSKEKWEWMQNLWYEVGEIDKKLPVEEYFTNEFLSGPPFKM